MAAAPPATSDPSTTFRADDVVEITGLQVRQELNGLRATIIDWSEAEERWRVLLEDQTGKMLRTEHLFLVRRAREPSPPPPAGIWTPQWKAPGGYAISLAPGDRVRVKLQEEPLLEHREGGHSLEGVVVRWEPDLNKWKVRLSNGSCELLAQTSLEPMEDWNVPGPTQGSTVRRQPPAEEEAPCFGADARVVVQGLQVRPDLNGKLGSVVTWDTAEHRYKVQLDDGTGKMLRPANLRLATVQDDPRLGAPEVSGRGHGGPQRWRDGAPGGDVRGPRGGLCTGQRVRVRGLIERNELNGCQGEVAGFDDVEQRWQVALDDGTGKLLKAANLEALSAESDEDADVDMTPAPRPGLHPGGRVRVQGLEVNQEINGMTGTLVAWDRMEERWQVRLDDGQGKLLRAAKLMPIGSDDTEGQGIAVGARVRLTGVRSNPELNGQLGIVQAWEANSERWQVLLDSGVTKNIRPANLQLCSDQKLDGKRPETTPELVAVESKLLDKTRPVATAPPAGRPAATAPFAASERPPPPNNARSAAYESPPSAAPASQPKVSTAPVRPSAPVKLGPGSRVMVSSQRRQDLDGQVGTALEWIDSIERWKVVLDDGTSLLTLSENISAISSGWNSKTAQMLD